MKISTPIDKWNKYWKKDTKLRSCNLIVIDIIRKLKVNNIIEIGAGSGVDIVELHNSNFNVIYSDFSEIALKKFKNRHPYIKAVKCDVRNLHFANNSFDLVFSLGLLEHFNDEDRKKAINEMFRISKRYVLIDVPQKFSPVVIYKKLLIFLNRWPFGKEMEFSYSQLVKDIMRVIKDVRIVERYGRNSLFFLRRDFKEKIYFKFIKPYGLEKIYMHLHRFFWWGWAESIGVVFEK